MFFHITLERNMQLHPRHFGPHLREKLVSKLMKDVEGTCSGRHGFVVAITGVDDVGKGLIREGTGFVTFPVKYHCVVFRPFKGEILEAVVTMVNKMGFFAEAGPVQVFVSTHLIPDDMEFMLGDIPSYTTSDGSPLIKIVFPDGQKKEKKIEEKKGSSFPQVISLLRQQPIPPHQRWWSPETVAVVTGASRGIGYAIARQLSVHDIFVVVAARDAGLCVQAVDSLREKDGINNVDCHELDISDAESVDSFAKWIVRKFGGVDILVKIQKESEVRLKIIGTRVDATEIFCIGTIKDDFLGVTNDPGAVA